MKGKRPVQAAAAATLGCALTVVWGPGTAQATGTPENGISFYNVVFNDGEPVVIGTTNTVQIPVTFTVKSTAPLDWFRVWAYKGTLTNGDALNDASEWNEDCRESKAGGFYFYDCDRVHDIDPRSERLNGGKGLINADATSWKVGATGVRLGGGFDDDHLSTTVQVKRFDRIRDMNASPEPVTAGKAITVKGTIQRANWDTNHYDGYSGRRVSLQFKPAGSSSYSTVKKVYSGTGGTLSTTVTATQDGAWRWKYYGNSTSGPATSHGDYVDVVQ